MDKNYYVLRGKIRYGPDTKKLYSLETSITKAIRIATQELSEVLAIPKEKYWTVALPTELYSVLDSYDRFAVKAAVEAWLVDYPDLKIGG